MCGIIGWVNKKESLSAKKNIFKKMTSTLKKRGPDGKGYYFLNNLLFGHRRLAIIDPQFGKQPMSYKNYTIIYNGELYNTNELREELVALNYNFDTNSDTEVLLKGYAHFKEKILNKLNGIFAFAIYDGNSVFLARDRVGVKPLYYTNKKNNFIFSSNIKGILKSKIIDPILDKNSLHILLGLFPSITPGSGLFKDIFELLPGHYMVYNGKVKIKKYWEVVDKKCLDSYEEAVIKIKNMVTNIIENQLVSDVGVACLLSGGLDSSIITAISALKVDGIATYSIDYEDNDKYFKKNNYQVSQDNYYIKLMSDKFKTKHTFHIVKIKELVRTLKQAVIAKDLPGMSDIDSSLLWFSKKIAKEQKVILSGECADEIFGGYPWFYKTELVNLDTFPWLRNLDKRQSLINKNLNIDIIKFVNQEYNKCKLKNKTKNIFKLNRDWFMATLLTRKDRMTMYASLEARVPFSDHNLIEYLWNLPFEYLYNEDIEKKILRDAFKDILPTEIVNRKKNPYPKTHNPQYTKIITKLVMKCLKDKKSILHTLFDREELNKLINNKDDCNTPWFGQLMTNPQLLAYIYQIHYWGKKYKIKIEHN